MLMFLLSTTLSFAAGGCDDSLVQTLRTIAAQEDVTARFLQLREGIPSACNLPKGVERAFQIWAYAPGDEDEPEQFAKAVKCSAASLDTSIRQPWAVELRKQVATDCRLSRLGAASAELLPAGQAVLLDRLLRVTDKLGPEASTLLEDIMRRTVPGVGALGAYAQPVPKDVVDNRAPTHILTPGCLVVFAEDGTVNDTRTDACQGPPVVYAHAQTPTQVIHDWATQHSVDTVNWVFLRTSNHEFTRIGTLPVGLGVGPDREELQLSLNSKTERYIATVRDGAYVSRYALWREDEIPETQHVRLLGASTAGGAAEALARTQFMGVDVRLGSATAPMHFTVHADLPLAEFGVELNPQTLFVPLATTPCDTPRTQANLHAGMFELALVSMNSTGIWLGSTRLAKTVGGRVSEDVQEHLAEQVRLLKSMSRQGHERCGDIQPAVEVMAFAIAHQVPFKQAQPVVQGALGDQSVAYGLMQGVPTHPMPSTDFTAADGVAKAVFAPTFSMEGAPKACVSSDVAPATTWGSLATTLDGFVARGTRGFALRTLPGSAAEPAVGHSATPLDLSRPLLALPFAIPSGPSANPCGVAAPEAAVVATAPESPETLDMRNPDGTLNWESGIGGLIRAKNVQIGSGGFGSRSSGSTGAPPELPRASVELGEIIVFGPLRTDEIEQFVKRRMSQIRYCFQREATKGDLPDLKLMATFRVVAGVPTDVSVAVNRGDGDAAQQVATCVGGRFYGMKFRADASRVKIAILMTMEQPAE